ncbi:MAG: SDR family oxidoreductase [Rickettsiales bacterium]|jgi:NAD(P)-dependent dehydrogenase (short-subunit alcohol dehydrogenase family)|nr:SDR family oxidoreductase [Rickettsiales bacterium]
MKKVLITGGTGAIGRAIIADFAKNPEYKIWFSYHNDKQAADELAVLFDATAVQIRDNDISAVPDDFDILVNNAGIDIFGDKTHTVPDEIFRKHLEVNTMLPFMLCKKMLPAMAARKWGRIVNISSVCGIKPSEDVVAYNVSKAGLNMLTKTIAKEYAASGITCNAVAPSTIADAGLGWEAIKFYGFEEELKACINANPSGRLGRAEEVAAAVVFLAGDSASFINGVILPVDGAQTA